MIRIEYRIVCNLRIRYPDGNRRDLKVVEPVSILPGKIGIPRMNLKYNLPFLHSPIEDSWSRYLGKGIIPSTVKDALTTFVLPNSSSQLANRNASLLEQRSSVMADLKDNLGNSNGKIYIRKTILLCGEMLEILLFVNFNISYVMMALQHCESLFPSSIGDSANGEIDESAPAVASPKSKPKEVIVKHTIEQVERVVSMHSQLNFVTQIPSNSQSTMLIPGLFSSQWMILIRLMDSNGILSECEIPITVNSL